MIVPMKKISIRGPKSELKNTIDVLKSSGAFEINNYTKSNIDVVASGTRAEELLSSQARIKAVLEFVKLTSRELKVKNNLASLTAVDEIAYTELKNVVLNEAKILELVAKIEAAAQKHTEFKNTKTRNANMIKELTPYNALDAAFNTLADTEHSFVLAGIMTSINFEQFKSDFDVSCFYIKEFPSTGTEIVAIIIGHKEDYTIAHKVFSYGFERCKFNLNMKAAEKIKELELQNTDLENQRTANLQKGSITPPDLKILKTYYDYLTNEIDTEEILSKTIQGETFFVINGWIIAKEQARIISSLKKVSDKIVVKVSEPSEIDKPPALVKNNPVVAPYSSITNLYSAPGPKDIDPNMFVAVFYFIFFGVMIGDIGYGIIMTLIALAVITFLKPQKQGFRNLVLIIGMGGISTIIWGMFFGTFFGASTSEGLLGQIFPSGIVNPVDNAMVFLGLTLGLGAVHIVCGLALKFYNLVRQGKLADAVFEVVPRVALFIGAGLIVLDMITASASGTLGLYVVVAAVILVAISGVRNKKGAAARLTGAFGAVYSLINYLTDIISYARLFALGLVGTVIATVANSLGAMLLPIPVLGIPLAVAIALVFHAFNLAMGLLSAYVHNARLQFIEFFSKFYQGGGKVFRPIGSGLRYTKFKEVK